MTKYSIYKLSPHEFLKTKTSDQYDIRIWKPNHIYDFPPTLGLKHLMWNIFHFLKIFNNSDYCILYLKEKKKIVHRSCVLPGSFQFPFVKRLDLQVSSTWTDPKYRNKGLAQIALTAVCNYHLFCERTFWYVTREDNVSSIKVCEKIGFKFFSIVTRRRFIFFSLYKKFPPP